MDKIVIFGSPGAGKSTFAQALGQILGIEVIHLDHHFWKPGWKEYSREDRIEIEQKLIKGKDRWIIEGTFLSSSDSRLKAADTIIFLDMPSSLCLRQAIKRYFTYRGHFGRDIPERPDMPEGCKEKLGLFYILKILGFPYRGRKLFDKKIKEIQASSWNKAEERCIHSLHSHEELEAFLRKLLPQQQVAEHAHEEVTTLVLVGR